MFAVLYKFNVKSGEEKNFQKHWAEMTEEFIKVHGGLGSRLHQSDDGSLFAYAKWPNREKWEENKDIVNKMSLKAMQDCLKDPVAFIPLTIINDMLLD